jgi:hypothetical protein
MKKLKEYITEGLFDQDSVNKINNSISGNIIKATYKEEAPGCDIKIIGTYFVKDGLESVFLDGIDITDFITDLGTNYDRSIILQEFNEQFGANVQSEFTVTFVFKKSPQLSHLFQGCRQLMSVDLSRLDISKVRSISEMFYEATKIQEVIFPKGQNNMYMSTQYMFSYCMNLKRVDMSQCIFKHITNTNSMFSDCEQLESFDISGLAKNNKSCDYFEDMFAYCKKIKEIDLIGFDMRGAKSAKRMFQLCENLKWVAIPFIPLEKHDLIFHGCDNLEKVNVYWIKKNTIPSYYKILIEDLQSEYPNIIFDETKIHDPE